jgi:hypothetical protein
LIVRKVWRQTWLMPDQRRDRAAFRFLPTESPIRVQLPPHAQLAGLTVALDGQQIDDFLVDESGLASVNIPEEKLGQESTLELWYGMALGDLQSRTELTGASIPQAENPGETYWQVLLPEKEHLLFDPPGFTPEMTWGWHGLWWRRQSAWKQRELESWCGASQQEDLPTVGNHLLFSSFGSAETLPLRTVERRWLLLIASSSVLAIGLALIHLPSARHPAWLLGLAVVTVALALTAPEMGILVGQAASLGGVCVIGMLLWQFTFARRPASAISETRLAKTSDTRRKELVLRPAESSQATLPLGIAAPEPRP